jgi:hypothetical protein
VTDEGQVPVGIDGRVPVPVAIDGRVPVAIDGRVLVGIDGRVPVAIDGRVLVGIDGRVLVGIDGRVPVEDQAWQIRKVSGSGTAHKISVLLAKILATITIMTPQNVALVLVGQDYGVNVTGSRSAAVAMNCQIPHYLRRCVMYNARCVWQLFDLLAELAGGSAVLTL